LPQLYPPNTGSLPCAAGFKHLAAWVDTAALVLRRALAFQVGLQQEFKAAQAAQVVLAAQRAFHAARPVEGGVFGVAGDDEAVDAAYLPASAAVVVAAGVGDGCPVFTWALMPALAARSHEKSQSTDHRA